MPVLKNVYLDYLESVTEVTFEGHGFGARNGDSKVILDGYHEAEIVLWESYPDGGNFIKFRVDPKIALSQVTVQYDAVHGFLVDMTIYVPEGYYAPDTTRADRNVAVNPFWGLISDFWNLFEDRDVVCNIWGSILEVGKMLYVNLEQIRKAQFIRTVPVGWETCWEKIPALSGATAMSVSDPDYDPDRPEFTRKMTLSREYLSIPTLFKTAYRLDYGKDNQLVEGRDYLCKGDKLLLAAHVVDTGEYWAPAVYKNTEVIFRQFGYLANVYDNNSEDYYHRVRAIWYALWSGPTLSVIKNAVNMILGLPYAKKDAVVAGIAEAAGVYTVTLTSGEVYSATQAPAVNIGDELHEHDAIFYTCSVTDRVSDSAWWLTPGQRITFDTGRRFDSGLLFDRNLQIARKSGNVANYNAFKVRILQQDFADTKSLTYIRYLLDIIKPAFTSYNVDMELSLFDSYADDQGEMLPQDSALNLTLQVAPGDIVWPDYHLDSCIKQLTKSDGRSYVLKTFMP